MSDPLDRAILNLFKEQQSAADKIIEEYKKALDECTKVCQELSRQNDEYKKLTEQAIAVAELWKRRAEGTTVN